MRLRRLAFQRPCRSIDTTWFLDHTNSPHHHPRNTNGSICHVLKFAEEIATELTKLNAKQACIFSVTGRENHRRKHPPKSKIRKTN